MPAEFKSDEIYETAVRQDGFALAFVPVSHRTKAIILSAVQQNGLVLTELFPKEKTLDVCLAAVRQNKEAYPFVPHYLRKEVQAAALQSLDDLLGDATQRANDRNNKISPTQQHINQNKNR